MLNIPKKREGCPGEIADCVANFKLSSAIIGTWGNLMKRETAVAILREIITNRKIHFKQSSLVNRKLGGYELHVESDAASGACLKPIAKRHGLALKEANGFFVIYKQH